MGLAAMVAAARIWYEGGNNEKADHTTDLYPATLTTSHVGGLLYWVVYVYLARKVWLRVRASAVAMLSAA